MLESHLLFIEYFMGCYKLLKNIMLMMGKPFYQLFYHPRLVLDMQALRRLIL